MIGLDLDNPNQKLLNFNSSFLNKNNYKYKVIKIENSLNHVVKEVISIHNLEEAFINNDKTKIFDELYQLSMVSSSLHILECLIDSCDVSSHLFCN